MSDRFLRSSTKPTFSSSHPIRPKKKTATLIPKPSQKPSARNNSIPNNSNMATHTTIEGVSIDMSKLNAKNKVLATTIITAITTAVKKQFDDERTMFQEHISQLEEKILSLQVKHEEEKQVIFFKILFHTPKYQENILRQLFQNYS